MDARTVAQIAGIEVGTLNVWVQRNLIPGMTIGARGRQRHFDLDTATRILIIAELVRFGFGAPQASFVVKGAFHFGRLLIVKYSDDPMRPVITVYGGGLAVSGEEIPLGEPIRPRAVCYGFSSEEEIPRLFEWHFPGGPPSVYAVVNVETIAKRMRQAYERWERSRGTEERH